MNRFRLAGVCAMGLVWLAVGVACTNGADTNVADGEEKSGKPETVVIPLDQIWAWQMPGTQPLEKLTAKFPRDMQQVKEIRKWLASEKSDKQAKSGFAVPGIELEALREAHVVLVERRKPQESFPVESDLSLVFFSYELSYYVHIHEVTRQKNTIIIRYRFVPHKTKELTSHIALIPMKNLPCGKYYVETIQSSMEREYVEAGCKPIDGSHARSFVSRRFSFNLEEKTESGASL